MASGKLMRRWILGLSCAVVPLLGCAHGPAPSAGGWFPWFRSTPLTELEKQRQEREEAIEKLEDPANLQIKYAQWREHLGDLTDARKSYQSALRQNPKSLEAKLGLARLDQLSGRTHEAEQGFQDALNWRPGNPLALNALGQFYASQKKWQKALPLLEQAADAAPHQLRFRHHLALALAASGDTQAAFHEFREAVGEAEAHYNIAFLLHEKGHEKLARKRLEQAIALNPNLKQAQALLNEMDEKSSGKQVAKAPEPEGPPRAKPVEQSVSEKRRPRMVESVRDASHREPEAAPRKPNRPLRERQVAHEERKLTNQQRKMPPQAQKRKHRNPESPRQQPKMPRQVPASWEAARNAMKTAEKASAAEAPTTSSELMSPNMPAKSPPTPPRPTWKKHDGEKKPTPQPPEYLPPYRRTTEERADNSPGGTQRDPLPSPGRTPVITPEQREQWENQLKSSAVQ